MIDPEIRRHIVTTLDLVARAEGVRILYAIESGSRAWGFGSPDSDYDVRFLYSHPRDWYIALDEGRDVIERPLDARLIDLAGWDIRKALRLLLKSNPALYEWLVSPIVYRGDEKLRGKLKEMFEAHASQRTLSHHYWSIASTHWKSNLERHSEVKQKRYFYAIRPLLSLGYVVANGRPPPMAIDALLAALPMSLEARAPFDRLLERKRLTPELGLGPRIPEIDAWIERELARLDPTRLNLSDVPVADMTAEASRFYRQVIGVD